MSFFLKNHLKISKFSLNHEKIPQQPVITKMNRAGSITLPDSFRGAWI
jgi:hypothetical protein